jgi:CDP-alcohol phosphatidyltransferase
MESSAQEPEIVPLRRPRRGVSVLPSLFTLANLFCGYACVVYAMRGEFEMAAPLIGIAVVLDMLDGRIARMTGTATEFGVQFDSMADIVSFGMAPAILAFGWGLSSLGRLGWTAGCPVPRPQASSRPRCTPTRPDSQRRILPHRWCCWSWCRRP